MLVISTQNWSILAKFAKKIQRNRLIFTDCFLAKFPPPRNFPWNRPNFLRICSWKSFEIWLFSSKIPQNRPIFVRILTFLPRKSPEIGWFFREFAPKFCFLFCEIWEALIICRAPWISSVHTTSWLLKSLLWRQLGRAVRALDL